MLKMSRNLGLLIVVLSLTGWAHNAGADWRVFKNHEGRATVRSLDVSASVGLLLDCGRDITLVTHDAFPKGSSGLAGEYDNGLKFVLDAQVPGDEPHTVALIRSDQIEALIRGLTNRHKLTLVDPNGAAHTFNLAGFGEVWRTACRSTG